MSDHTQTVQIRDVPSDRWRQVKIDAAAQNLSIREYVIRALGSHEAMLDALREIRRLSMSNTAQYDLAGKAIREAQGMSET